MQRFKYRVKYYWNAFIELCGYCKWCKRKKMMLPSERMVCTNIFCNGGKR